MTSHSNNDLKLSAPVENSVLHPSLYSLTKRAIDIFGAIAGLIFAAPLMLLIAIIIKVTDPGPALFKQTRIGARGQRFTCYKFRTMIVNSAEALDELLRTDPDARREWESVQKLTNDPRITPLGKFLRASSLDELPQLFNILVGDMSLIGPRPIVQNEISKYGAAFQSYISVRPGLTGLWQVSGRSDTSYPERVGLDIDYVENWSIRFDIMILLKTIPVLLFSSGAR